MSFINRIQIYDAEHGLPRRADEPFLPAYHAFIRCMQDVGQAVMLVVCGLIAASLLLLASRYLAVGFHWQIIFAALMVIAIFIALAEASQILLPYYEFNQLLTYGTAQWASPLYLESAGFARAMNKAPAQGELMLGKLPRPLRRPFNFALNSEAALGSLVFFGPPRSGKSVLLMNYLRSLAQGGWSVVIIDPKGELFEYCARHFQRVYRLDFQHTECSDRWNFLLHCKGDKEYAHMMATIMLGLEGTKYAGTDPFWSEAEVALLTAILLYVPTIIEYPTPAMIHEFIALRSYEQLCDELTKAEDYEVRVQWGTFTKAPDQTRGSVFTGLAAKINPFTIDAARAVTASLEEDEIKAGARYINFAHLREPGTAIFIVIPEGAASRYKIPLATFIGQAVEHLRAGVVEENTVPVMFVVDEAAHVPVANLKELPGVGRGRRFAVMLFYQNLSQGYDMYGEHGFNAILGSINTKTFLPGCDHVTARYASEIVGQTTVWGRGFDDAPGTENDKSRSTEASRALVDPNEVRQLPVHRQAITVIETMPPVKWTYPKSAKEPPRVVPRKYGAPRIVNFIEAERESLKRKLLNAAIGEDGRGIEEETTHTAELTQPQETANGSSTVAASTKQSVSEATNETMVLSKTISPETVYAVTREAIDHLADLYDDPLPSSPPDVQMIPVKENPLDRVLNP